MFEVPKGCMRRQQDQIGPRLSFARFSFPSGGISECHQLMPGLSSCLKLLLWLSPLVFLWQALIRHLSVEWSLNPQYGYGWAVPFLCGYLIWQDPGRIFTQKRAECATLRGGPWGRSRLALTLIFALLYAPTRLIQEANPEWRLVSWFLGLEVVGLTLLMLPFIAAFPFLFFLVAVPWPTLVESPIIGALTAAVTACTVEVLGFLGIPSVLHGNVIELGPGMVGVDDACSGIRSFQASLMIALFFGAVYNLTLARRFLCIIAGFALSLQFNLIRTTLLAWLAANKGLAAMARWHDPAGVTILVICFLAVWLLAMWLRTPGRQQTLTAQTPTRTMAFGHQGVSAFHLQFSGILGLALACWLGLVELGTETWYRVHERRLSAPITWRIDPPRHQDGFCEVPFPPNTRQFLRFDEGLDVSWREGPGLMWQAIFMRWNPGRVAVHLAKNHTPADCLTAAGHEIRAESGLQLVPVGGLDLPFRSYSLRDERGPAYVFYCLWEDRATQQSFETKWLSYRNRLMPVLAGQRNSGQRSLELALWGAADDQAAETALRNVLPRLIKLEQ